MCEWAWKFTGGLNVSFTNPHILLLFAGVAVFAIGAGIALSWWAIRDYFREARQQELEYKIHGWGQKNEQY